MNWNYCPNCGQKLQYSELTVISTMTVIECTRCGWEMREYSGRDNDIEDAGGLKDDDQ